MKKTKIIFFGAMAAIMMSAGAHAAVTQIASTDYVDTLVGTKADTTAVTALGNRVTANETAIQTNTTNIGIVSDHIGDLDNLEIKGDAGVALTTIVDAINAVNNKPAVDAYTKKESDAKYATQETVTTLENSLGNLATMDTVGTAQIDANAVTTEKILNANVTEEKLSVDVVEKLNKTTDLTGYATQAWVEGKNYIPKPSPECAAASGTCVLTVNTDGALEWMAVTAPTTGE